MSKISLTSALCIFFAWICVAFGQPASVPFLGLVASACGYALFWWALSRASSKKLQFVSSVFWFASVQAVQLSWMTSTSYVGALVLLLYGILALLIGLQFGLLTLLVLRLRQFSYLSLFALAALWTLVEWLRLFVLSGFSWNPVGLALTGSLYPLQASAIWGVYGLSFWVIATNLVGLRAWFKRKNRQALIFWVAMVAFPYVWGSVQLGIHLPLLERTQENLSALVVQPSIAPDQLPFSRTDEMKRFTPVDYWIHLLNLLKDQPQADLIVLPEGAVPYGTHQPISAFEWVPYLFQSVWPEKKVEFPPLDSPSVMNHEGGFIAVTNLYWAQTLANALKADLVLGMEDQEIAFRGAGSVRQAACFLSPFRFSVQKYAKRVLVPVGEYIPFHWCRSLAARYGIMNSFSPGTHPVIFQGKVPMGVSICYEETYGHLMRENRQLGAQLLLNLTNDGWYPGNRLPHQHFSHARLRAVENGFPLIRSCNTGVTVAVDSLGRVIKELGAQRKDQSVLSGVLAVQIPIYTHNTLYTIWGDYFIVGLSLVLMLLFVINFVIEFNSFNC